MKIINKKIMQNLSFPDFDIEKIDFSFKKKSVEIFIDGAWLDIDGGIQLGKGILYFNDWENFSISRFDLYTEKWVNMNESELELLKDICEIKFSDSTVCLYGFGKRMGQWVEWKFKKTKMHAEFEI